MLGALTSVGEAMSAVWADNLALPFLRSAVDGHRAEGRLVWLAQTLVLQAWVDARRGAVREALTAAAEAASVASETRQLRYVPVANLAQAVAAAELGDDLTAQRLIAEAEAMLLPMGAHPLLALAAFARGRLALANEHPAEAYADLLRIFTPTDTAYQPFVRGWALADLADAAVHGNGDLDLVRDLLSQWQQIAIDTKAPSLLVQLAYAHAVLADNAIAEDCFRSAMAPARTGGRSTPRARSSPTAGGCAGSTGTPTLVNRSGRPPRSSTDSVRSATPIGRCASFARPANEPADAPPTPGPS